MYTADDVSYNGTALSAEHPETIYAKLVTVEVFNAGACVKAVQFANIDNIVDTEEVSNIGIDANDVHLLNIHDISVTADVSKSGTF